ncbi:transducin family protein/WD-40 repeat family protein [Schizopora paradoxa]|uniref:Transducin family protein/WD-40 repeat family protein n=1 Tax=Schizopora paradoxa TaxID=27342 RepID=A0A0H2RY66_9AGAM|nr:transducin family protein/WD-40 repeat family protein [Schizopora paradoxa]
MSSLISCTAWVRRGVSAQHPQKYNLDEKEIERVSAFTRTKLEDVKAQMEEAQKAAQSMGRGLEADETNEAGSDDDESAWVDEDDDAMDEDSKPKPENQDDDLAQYNLDDYDKESASIATGPFSNIKGLTYYKDDEEDPYITLKEDDEELEREELEIRPSDNLVVTAKTEDDISKLEVYVYDETEENLYVHHDILLPTFPLCLEWLDFRAASSSRDTDMVDDSKPQFGNYIAVGTFDPDIEIWSLDTVESVFPDFILGRPDKTAAHVPEALGTGKKKKKKTKARLTSAQYHVDAVLSLSWNRAHRNLLASASADKTVKLWDLNRDPTGNGDENGALRSFDVHSDKVQAVQWNEKEPTVLLTGSYDRTVRTFDSRAPDAGLVAVVGSDVEAIRWDPWENHGFYVSLENGIVLNFDARTLPSSTNAPSQSRFMLAAHDGAASALDVNPHIRGCIVTGGTDKMVKLWNVNNQVKDGKKDVSLAISRDLEVGKVFSATFSPDDPLTIAVAGSKAKLQIWDASTNGGVRKTFESKIRESGRELKTKTGGGVVGLASDDEESGEED